MLIFLLAQATTADLATRSPAAPPIAYVSVRGDAATKRYLSPSAQRASEACPKRGDKAWSETINFPAVIVRFDCPVGVSFKTWEPSGRRVHVGIKKTTTLHPGALPTNSSVTYELVAPQ